MPFDPNLPQPGQPNDANVIRDQFNALKEICDNQAAVIANLTLRVAALENPNAPHEATGFADARFDGLLTPTGDTYNGQPVYTTPSGMYFCFRAGVWVATDMNPMTGTGEAYYVGTDTLTGSYTANFGPAPGGTVS